MPKIHTPTVAPVLGRTVINSEKVVSEAGLKLGGILDLPTPFSLPGSLALKIKIVGRDDNFIKNSSIRSLVCDQLMRQPNAKSVGYQLRTGVIELGPNQSFAIPLSGLPSGLGCSLDVGFAANSVLTYEEAKPKINITIKPHRGKKPLFFPHDVTAAQKMKAGHEVSISGVGTLQASSGVSAKAFVGMENTSQFGANLSAGGKATKSKGYTLSILAIDGKGLVRMSVTKNEGHNEEISMKLRAGILKAMPDLPAFGSGTLAHLAEKGIEAGIAALLENYGSVNASVSSEKAKMNQTVCAYDLDLSKICAQEAFFRLLSLNPFVVDRLMSMENSGIDAVRFDQEEKKKTHSMDFRALNSCIYGKQKAKLHHDGSLMRDNGSRVIFSDEVFNEKHDNYFLGQRETTWEGITLKDNDGKFHTYYHFLFQKKSTMPKQDEVDRYFTLARMLDIDTTCTEKTQLIDMSTIQKFFSQDDDVKATIDLYFTEEGVARIQHADTNRGVEAFMTANSDIATVDPQLTNTLPFLEGYLTLDKQFLSSLTSTHELQVLANNYHKNFSRDFEKDYALYQDARKFGDLVGKFYMANDTEQAQKFFAVLGKSDIDYPEVLCALAMIAGRKNLKVHALSLQGGEIILQSKDEGEIVHPRVEATRLFINNWSHA